MSASLIRKGLDLLSDDIKDVGKSQKSKKKKTSSQKGSLMDQISTNKQGVRKQIRRLQTHRRAGPSTATVKDKQVRNAIEEYRKTQKTSQLRSNLKYFLGNNHKATQNCTDKIIKHNTGRLSRHQPEKPVVKPKKQETSVFSEEDFQKFQKEYFSKL